MLVRKMYDRVGNNITCGDMVCFVSEAGELARVRIAVLYSGRTADQDFIGYDDDCPKVPAKSVIKCY